MVVAVSHPTGNANVRAVLRGLSRANVACEFHTTLAFPPATAQSGIGGLMAQTEARRRTFPEVPWKCTHIHPSREALRQLAPRLGLRALTAHETGFACVDSVYRHLDRAVARRLGRRGTPVRAVYAYEDGALHSFSVAHEQGIPRIYELPIAHWRVLDTLLREEAELWPDWASTIGGLGDSAAKRDRKDREINLADRIVVPSSFVRDSVRAAFPDKERHLQVVSFGSPPASVDRPAERRSGEPLRLFFAGQLTQRKGLAYLAAAVDALDVDWQLRLAGPLPETESAGLQRLLSNPRCTWLGRIPHADLLHEMSQAHVFVFPSIVEGFALVIPEAMSAGLPILTTPNSGADIVLDGREGFVVPIRDPQALADRITRLAEDETLRREMAMAALAAAAGSPWSVYEDAVASLVRKAVDA